jgi:antitoxin component YwqK of YwqJK toxin-antitoxin module
VEEFIDGVLIGITRYYKNGLPEIEEHRANGKRTGLYKEWYDDGTIKLEENYQAGVQQGQQTKHTTTGAIDQVRFYERGKAMTAAKKQGLLSNLLKTSCWDGGGSRVKQKTIQLTNPAQKMYLFFSWDGELVAKRTFENGVLIDEWGDPGVQWEDEAEMYR